jgi:ethanolamine kinase
MADYRPPSTCAIDGHYDVEEIRNNLFALYPKLPKSGWTILKTTKGLTNLLFLCTHLHDIETRIMYRIYGKGTERIIDRDHELNVLNSLSEAGLAAPILGKFSDALVYGYVDGNSLDHSLIRTYWKEISSFLGTFHRKATNAIPQQTPILIGMINRWISHLSHDSEYFSTQVSEIESFLSKQKWPIVFCHNDLLSENILLSKNDPDNSINFIDFEYGGYNYAAFDIGNHLCEYIGVAVDINLLPSRDLISDFVAVYTQNSQVDVGVDQVLYFMKIANLMWAIWARLQAQHSCITFDYNEYSRKRLDLYARFDELYAQNDK